jgi:hypothetical protein
MTVERLEAEMSADEFIEWSVYHQIESERQKRAMKDGSNKARNAPNR